MNRYFSQAGFSAARFCLFLLVLCFLSYHTNAQQSIDCARLHNAVTYSYPKNSNDHYVSRIEGEWVHETNISNGDTILSKVKWKDGCSYTMEYVAGGQKLPEAALDLLRTHKIAYKVLSMTDSFFVYSAFFDKTSNLPVTTDTAWFYEKAGIGKNELFKRMANDRFLRKEHFRDTSRYAVLYLYRPGKLSNSKGDFLVYCNDNIMCVAKNRTGFIFKILKEGPLRLESRLFKDRSATQVDIQFGKTYYVKAMIHWTISSRLYNFKLEMAPIDADKGAQEFAETDQE